MNRTVFWRLVWKEYRLQRAFWIAMLVLAILGQLFVVLVPAEPTPDRPTWLFAVALVVAAFYALGAGATLFATEHERGTYDFQRSLPVSARRLLAAKMMFAGSSTLAMFAVTWLLALAMSAGRLPRPAIHGQLWGLWGFAAIELLVWGVFFSLRSHRPLVAVILTVSCASVIVHLLAGDRVDFGGMEGYLAALPYRAAVVVLVAVADILMGWRWLDEQGRTLRRGTGQPGAATGKTGSAVDSASRRTMLGRLVWQHLRQSSRLILALAVMLLPLVILIGLKAFDNSGAMTAIERMPLGGVLVFFAALGGYLVPPLMGTCVFQADQSGNAFRFLTEHGVRPRYAWLSRQLVWLAVLLMGMAIVAIAFLPMLHIAETLLVASIVLGFVFLAYCCGQLCSMYIHSGILAAVFSIVLTFALCAWAGFMHVLKISWVWSVAPLPLAFLFATWLRAPNWLLERGDWRARLQAILPVVVPMAAILIAVPPVRVSQVPYVDPGFDPQEYARPATAGEQATMALYREASDQVERFLKKDRTASIKSEPDRPDRLSSLESLWLKENQDALRLALEASRREEADFFLETSEAVGSYRLMSLVQLTLMSGKQLEIEGKLDAALDRYLAALRMSAHMRHRTDGRVFADGAEGMVYSRLLHWSTRPGQATQRIIDAIGRIRKITAKLPSSSDEIKCRHLFVWRLLHADPDTLEKLGSDDFTKSMLQRVAWFMPWERARAVRQLNQRTLSDLDACRQAEQAVAENGLVVPEFFRSHPQGHGGVVGEWAERLVDVFTGDSRQTVLSIGQIETRRRTTWLVLALEAWKLQHGKLPEKLDAVAGPHLSPLPNDPYTGERFCYFPHGLPIKMEWSELQGLTKQTLQPGKPFLWSGGIHVIPAGTGGDVTTRYRVRDEYGAWSPRALSSEYDVWRAGWIVPIP